MSYDVGIFIGLDADQKALKAAEAIRLSLVAAGVAADKLASKNLSGLTQASAQATTAANSHAQAINAVERAVNLNTVAVQRGNVVLREQLNAYQATTTALERYIAQKQRLPSVNQAEAASINALAGSLSRYVAAYVSARTVFQIGAGATGANIQQQGLINTLSLSSGGELGAAGAYSKIADEANRIGVNFVAAAQGYSRFAAAANGSDISAQQQFKTFVALSESARRLNLDAAQTGSVFLAVEQIISKGVVSMQELRLQLGNNLPGSFAIAARAMGVTTKELDKLVSSGELLARDFIPKFTAQLAKEIPLGNAGQSIGAEIERMKNSLFELQVAFGGAFSESLTKAIKQIADATNNLSASGEVIKGVTNVLGYGALGWVGYSAAALTSINGIKIAWASLLAMPAPPWLIAASAAAAGGTVFNVGREAGEMMNAKDQQKSAEAALMNQTTQRYSRLVDIISGMEDPQQAMLYLGHAKTAFDMAKQGGANNQGVARLNQLLRRFMPSAESESVAGIPSASPADLQRFFSTEQMRRSLQAGLITDDGNRKRVEIENERIAQADRFRIMESQGKLTGREAEEFTSLSDMGAKAALAKLKLDEETKRQEEAAKAQAEIDKENERSTTERLRLNEELARSLSTINALGDDDQFAASRARANEDWKKRSELLERTATLDYDTMVARLDFQDKIDKARDREIAKTDELANKERERLALTSEIAAIESGSIEDAFGARSANREFSFGGRLRSGRGVTNGERDRATQLREAANRRIQSGIRSGEMGGGQSFGFGFDSTVEEWGNSSQRMMELGKGAANSLESGFDKAFSSMIDGTKSFEAAFSDMTNSILADIGKMLVNQFITKNIVGAVGGLFGSVGSLSGPDGQGGAGLGIDTFGNHYGGLIGFGQHRRMHGGGIVGDEVPTVARKGEVMFTPEQLPVIGKMIATAVRQAGGGRQGGTIINTISSEDVAEALLRHPDAIVNAISMRSSDVRRVLS